ncbi:MAG: M60 family metallopeptidase [Opitutales bacterium]
MRHPLALLALTLTCLASPEDIRPEERRKFAQPAEAERAALHKSIKDYMALDPAEVKAHPAAADFPGAVNSKARVTRTVSYDPDLLHRWDTKAGNAPNLATGPDAWQETGLYAAPGETVVIDAAALPEGRTVHVIVGCHRDSLLRLDDWKRFPIITRSFELKTGKNKVANAFGGQLFIHVRGREAGQPGKTSARLAFANAVEMPTYVLGKDTPQSWAKSRGAPAPWGTLVGRAAILHVRSEDLAKMADPKALLEWWDKCLSLEDDLVALRRLAPERVVPDRQISAGYMHSGYPFMCWIKPSAAEMIDLGKLTKQGNWGFFHELGHNHQRRDWTFDGQVEVTCNFFSLYLMEKLVGLPTGQGHGSMKDLDALLRRRFGEPENKGPFEQLGTFVLLIRAHGWEPLRATLRSYADEPGPKGKEEQQSSFVERYGRFSKSDVSDYFVKLGYHVGDSTRAKLASLPKFRPALPSPQSK